MIVRIEFKQTTLLYSAQFSVLYRLHGVRRQPMRSCSAAFTLNRNLFRFQEDTTIMLPLDPVAPPPSPVHPYGVGSLSSLCTTSLNSAFTHT